MAINLETYELNLKAKTAFAEYLALPDRRDIIARLQLVNSASDAVQQIQEAAKEAWRIRKTLAASWSPDVLIKIEHLLVIQLGKLHPDEKMVHPIIGPVFDTIYPNGPAKYQVEEILKAEMLEEKKRVKESRSFEPHKAAAKRSTQLREHRLMIQCTKDFVIWADEEGKELGLDAVAQFPKVKGIIKKRANELLRTLISAQKRSSIREELVQTLQKCGFPHVTQDAVDECMNLLEKREL